jgi:deoxyribose-phosphate aldolase
LSQPLIKAYPVNPDILASRIDHTLLKSDVTRPEIVQLCREAVEHRFAAVCIPPYFVREAAAQLAGSGVEVATVIGFPMGYSNAAAKREEVIAAVAEGATEIDFVANIAAIREGNARTLAHEIEACLAEKGAALLKVIVESGSLSTAELEACCLFYAQFPVDYLKTSTGMGPVGATVEAVRTMRRLLPQQIKIKAAGGIRTFAGAMDMIEAGADRLGTSASLSILREASR